MELRITSFSNPRLVTKMYRLDYLQFFSQETLGAPRPQSHLHEFIDSWLVPWKRQRDWVANPQGSGLYSWEPLGSTLTWKSSSLHKHVAVTPSLCTKLVRVKKMAWWERKQKKCLLQCWAGLTSTVLPFSSTKRHVKDGCKGKGRKLNTFSRLSDMRCHQATHQCQRSPCSPML